MAEDQPGPPRRRNHDDQPGDRPTEPLSGPAQPPQVPPSSGQSAGEVQASGDTAPVPGGQSVSPTPAFAAGGPPPEVLAGFWRRLVAAFLDWLLLGVLAAAIGALVGIDTASPPPVQGDGFQVQFNWAGPYLLVELVYFTYFHATSAGQSIGNKILGIRVLDADTGRSLPYVRAFVRVLVSNLSALPCFLGYFWMLWDRRKQTWHDMVANSLVVRASAYPPGEFGRPAR
jgi:uncharacterized RDD family membrane protein YckC